MAYQILIDKAYNETLDEALQNASILLWDPDTKTMKRTSTGQVGREALSKDPATAQEFAAQFPGWEFRDGQLIQTIVKPGGYVPREHDFSDFGVKYLKKQGVDLRDSSQVGVVNASDMKGEMRSAWEAGQRGRTGTDIDEFLNIATGKPTSSSTTNPPTGGTVNIAGSQTTGSQANAVGTQGGNKTMTKTVNGVVRTATVAPGDVASRQAQGWTLSGTQGAAQSSGTANPPGGQQSGQQSGQPTGVNLIFRGDEALVKFSSDFDGPGGTNESTVWLVNTQDKTIRPFLSEEAYSNYYGDPTALANHAAQGLIVTVDPSELVRPGSQLSQFHRFSDSEGIQSDGSVPSGGEQVNAGSIGNRYGNTSRNQDREQQMFQAIDGWALNAHNYGIGINQDTVQTVKTSPDILGKYLNALTYGGYTIVDVLRDMKRLQLIKDGESGLQNVKVIDEAMKANEFYSSSAGSAAKSNPLLSLPEHITGLATEDLDQPLYAGIVPDEIFKILVPPVDWTSPEAQEEAENIKAAYYDVMMKQYEASTEQEKALADYEWGQFRDEIKKAYNIRLSNDSNEAWGQLEQLTGAFVERNLTNSGLMNEAVDRYLKDVRRTDQQLRDEKITTEEEKRRQYYLNSATPQQIQADLSEDEKVKWGLKPSTDMLSWFSEANLKGMFPDLTPQELADYKNSIIDENGNYRSGLYQTLFANKYKTGQEKKDYQQYQLFLQKLEEDRLAKKKYENFDEYATTTGSSAGTNPDTSEGTSPQSGANSVSTGGYYQDDKGTVMQFPSGQNLGPEWKPTTAPSSSQTPSVQQPAAAPQQPAQTPQQSPAPLQQTADAAWTTFIKGKNDVLGKNWQGYKPIAGSEYQTPTQQKTWQNVQRVGSTLYGYRAY